jgi:hypothetical protein
LGDDSSATIEAANIQHPFFETTQGVSLAPSDPDRSEHRTRRT